jgi:predicted permease
MTVDVDGTSERIDGQIVTGNYFDVLGVHPIIGRSFLANDDRISAPVRVAVLSYRTWLQRHGGRPDVVGQSISLNGKPYAVIGVAPRGFFGSMLGDAPEVWVPMALQPEVRPPSAGALRQRMSISTSGAARIGALLDFRDTTWLELVGRLKNGSSISQAASALDVVGRRLAMAYPESNRDRSVTAMRLGEAPGVRTRARPVLQLLSAAVAIVLVIACANVASLLLARAISRRREVAVRVAIGAGRARLIRQWLTESILLGILGSVGGLLVVVWATPLLYGLGVLEDIDLSVNWRVFIFALISGVITGIVFGLASTLQLVQRNTLPALRDEGSTLASGARSTTLRNAFIVAQVALSLMLLVGAGLFIRTFRQALAVDLGYEVDGMLLAEVSPGDRYTPPEALAFYRDLLDRLNALPGVRAAGAARVTVLSGSSRTVAVSVDGQPLRQDRSNVIAVRANVVSDRYLEAMGIAVVHGRGIQSSDIRTAPRVAVVSQALGKRLWPNADPVGHSLVTDSQTSFQVVGVVPDTVYRSATDPDPRPFYYVPLQQNYEAGVTLHLRTTGDPMLILPAVRQALRDLDPTVALTRPRRLIDEFDRSTTPQRTMALLTGVLSAIALLLAAVGLYGVMAFAARQRAMEVALRLALGATPASILSLVVMRGVRLVVVGAGLGLVGAIASVRFVRGQLFGVEPSDPFTWFAVAGVLLGVALVACAIPAARAMRVQPSSVLRAL